MDPTLRSTSALFTRSTQDEENLIPTSRVPIDINVIDTDVLSVLNFSFHFIKL
jgi:hypothetical protein